MKIKKDPVQKELKSNSQSGVIEERSRRRTLEFKPGYNILFLVEPYEGNYGRNEFMNPTTNKHTNSLVLILLKFGPLFVS